MVLQAHSGRFCSLSLSLAPKSGVRRIRPEDSALYRQVSVEQMRLVEAIPTLAAIAADASEEVELRGVAESTIQALRVK
jgi:5-enolpyruvylshikimate-3-phosphate synthase